MLHWIKDWTPTLAIIGTFVGVLITVRRASKTYSHGLFEKRKDHQRELLADLIANGSQRSSQLEITYMAMGKMTEKDLFEYADTDSMHTPGELAKFTRIALVKCLSEVADNRISPLVAELELKRRTLTDGPEVAPLFDFKAGERLRFEATMAMLRRVSAITRLCDELQLAAIQALQVKINVLTRRRRFWNWLTGANIIVDAAVAKHY